MSREVWRQEETYWTGCIPVLLGKMSRGPSEAEGFLPCNAVRTGEGMKGFLHRRPMTVISVGRCRGLAAESTCDKSMGLLGEMA